MELFSDRMPWLPSHSMASITKLLCNLMLTVSGPFTPGDHRLTPSPTTFQTLTHSVSTESTTSTMSATTTVKPWAIWPVASLAGLAGMLNHPYHHYSPAHQGVKVPINANYPANSDGLVSKPTSTMTATTTRRKFVTRGIDIRSPVGTPTPPGPTTWPGMPQETSRPSFTKLPNLVGWITVLTPRPSETSKTETASTTTTLPSLATQVQELETETATSSSALPTTSTEPLMSWKPNVMGPSPKKGWKWCGDHICGVNTF
ncbi:hypothetical protein BT63DRAFT_214628 [Microthyrium microscopicum]|uniref:Uncharacterized protein n=1 Tax=Microthyrium microscopicum TaxID=703497 RepID=A0A6A6UIQ5_9PEZI|nr:hypothetical protein BT63DRAFT_214628 [Microthyrium microscopicum]